MHVYMEKRLAASFHETIQAICYGGTKMFALRNCPDDSRTMGSFLGCLIKIRQLPVDLPGVSFSRRLTGITKGPGTMDGRWMQIKTQLLCMDHT